MRHQKTTSIQTLVHEAMTSTKYRQKWLDNLLLSAWQKVLPFGGYKIEKFFFAKGGSLYVKLTSPLLSYELKLNKAKLITALKNEIQKLGGDIHMLKDIVFL